MLAINEINAAGGVLDKQIEPIIEDGASDWPTFAEKAKKLLQQDAVSVVFGRPYQCQPQGSQASLRKEPNGLLFYPVQYEGLSNPRISSTPVPNPPG